MSKNYRLSADETQLLKTVLADNPRPERAKILELANKLSVSQERVYNWFSNQRHKLKQKTTQPKPFRGKYRVICTFPLKNN